MLEVTDNSSMAGTQTATSPVPYGDASTTTPKKSDLAEKDPEVTSKRAAVKDLIARYVSAKGKWTPDFKRMRDNMDFAFGFQREDQMSLDIDEYTANITLRNINQKVASLYAKNPKAEWQRRKRRDFVLWDEKNESLQPLQMKIATGIPLNPPEMALMNDYLHGMQTRGLIEAVGMTLEILYQYQIDEHDPDFKLQMKALVRRVCICGVAYCRLSFEREHENFLPSSGMGNTISDTVKKLSYLSECLKEDYQDESSPKIQQIKQLMESALRSMTQQQPEYQFSERLVFDFLPATSVIPDEYCTNLKGFFGAREVFIETIMPLDEVNAFFETDIKPGGDLKLYTGEGKVTTYNPQEDKTGEYRRHKVCLIECLNKSTQTHCFVVEGYKDYVQEPEAVEPGVRNFWPIFSLTFNDVESDPCCKASIFPPSDVELMKSPQKEWNRIREELRKHRNANAAKYLAAKGMLTQEDLDKLENADSNAVIEIQGLAQNADVTKLVSPLVHDKIEYNDPRYDAQPMLQDILLAVGAQDANIGPPNPKGTATGQSIAEQSRSVGISSNIDDLNDFLGCMCGAGGEMLLQEASPQTVERIVGPGGVLPQQNKQDFLNEIFLKHVADSSGKPNKVLDVQNWQMLAPVLMQAGANPQFMVRETIKRLDDRMDPSEAFPLVPTAPSMQPVVQGDQQQGPQPPHKSGSPPRQQRRPGPGKQQNVQGQRPQPQPQQ